MDISHRASHLDTRRIGPIAFPRIATGFPARVPPTTSPLVLGDLLAEERFGLRLVAGGESALRSPVAGVHPIEIDAPTRWLAPRWVMLTTGSRLHRRPAAQRALVRELQESGIGALGYGLGVVSDVLPPALVDEARRRDFPLFEVPLGTPFREIVRHADRALLIPEVRAYERLPAIHRYMFDALAQPDPTTTLLERLGSLVDAHVLLFDEDGVVAFASDDRPTGPLWEQIARRADSHLVEFEHEGHHVVAVPTSIAIGGSNWWIAAYPSRAGTTNPLLKPAVQAVAPLAAAIKRIDDVGHERERQQRAAVLTAALDARDERELRDVTGRVLGFGIDFAAPVHLVHVSPRPDAPRTLADTLGRAIQRKLHRTETPGLVVGREGTVVALIQLPPEELRELLAAVVAEHPAARAGSSCPLTDMSQLPLADRDARTAVAISLESDDGAPVFFVECDISALLVSQAQDATLRRTITRRLEPLREHPQLYETLSRFFATSLDIGASAKALYVHPNTMRNRITRIEELIGGSLREPAVIAEIHLALTAMPTLRT